MARENALFFENLCRRALGADDRGALGGLVDADNLNIVGVGYYVIAASLAPYYKISNQEKRELIDNYLEKYLDLSDIGTPYEDYDDRLGKAKQEFRVLIEQLEEN
ncbi:hypothetical protein [Lysinibacillus sp. FSL K6-3209]|uniref:hypothetical protein n=1 Tax=Lysinibacillus sp. FSL K6-3209 TaxID=2921497 RepID=UPI0030D8608B